MRELSFSLMCALALLFAACGDSGGGSGGVGGTAGSGGSGGTGGGGGTGGTDIDAVCTAYCEAGCIPGQEELPACLQACIELVGDCQAEFAPLAECAIRNDCNSSVIVCPEEQPAFVACISS